MRKVIILCFVCFAAVSFLGKHQVQSLYAEPAGSVESADSGKNMEDGAVETLPFEIPPRDDLVAFLYKYMYSADGGFNYDQGEKNAYIAVRDMFFSVLEDGAGYIPERIAGLRLMLSNLLHAYFLRVGDQDGRDVLRLENARFNIYLTFALLAAYDEGGYWEKKYRPFLRIAEATFADFIGDPKSDNENHVIIRLVELAIHYDLNPIPIQSQISDLLRYVEEHPLYDEFHEDLLKLFKVGE